MINNRLKDYFPIIREREDIKNEINNTPKLYELFSEWNPNQQEMFLDFCSGVKGAKLLYDSFFKEIMSPEYAPERLNELLSLILGEPVTIKEMLPNDSTRIADETSLVILDIVVQLKDGSIANVEVQKIGYMFPGQRAACYSADLLLRQYKRVRSRLGKNFSYKNIKTVYTIVLFESSPAAFNDFPDTYIHNFNQKSDTGIEIDLLQRYIFIPLDIFINMLHNKGINNRLDAWFTFLSSDLPEDIISLIDKYPDFKPLYDEVYSMCLNTEKVMQMFSKELAELDKNTVQYMIDEMQNEIDGMKEQLDDKDSKIHGMKQQLTNKDNKIHGMKQQLTNKDSKIHGMKQQLTNKDSKIHGMEQQLDDKDNEIALLKKQLEDLKSN